MSNLPNTIRKNLNGFRGYYKVDFTLEINEVEGKWVASYVHHGAEYALAVQIANTKEEAIKKMKKYVKQNNLCPNWKANQ